MWKQVRAPCATDGRHGLGQHQQETAALASTLQPKPPKPPRIPISPM
jgi:hypothetical protein